MAAVGVVSGATGAVPGSALIRSSMAESGGVVGAAGLPVSAGTTAAPESVVAGVVVAGAVVLPLVKLFSYCDEVALARVMSTRVVVGAAPRANASASRTRRSGLFSANRPGCSTEPSTRNW